MARGHGRRPATPAWTLTDQPALAGDTARTPAAAMVAGPGAFGQELAPPPAMEAAAHAAEAPAPPVARSPALPPIRWQLLATAAVVVVTVSYSVALFLLTEPRLTPALRRLVARSGEEPHAVTPLAFLVGITAAFGEEIIFRLGIQNYLAERFGLRGGRYWLAITLTAALWTAGHTGALEPGWVKLAQIFPAGLLLGWLFRRTGLECCILVHALFNIALLLPASRLIGV